jgi:hypothetical protein
MSERDDEHFEDEYDPSACVTEMEGQLDGFEGPVVAAEEIDSLDVTDAMPEDEEFSTGEAPEATSEVDETEPDIYLDTDQVDVTEDMGAFAGEQLVSSTGGTDIDATEDMFVVLPDGDGDIPLVETQEVSFGETELAEERNTEIFDPDEEEMESGIDEPYGQSTELDHLASELDDELLDDEGDVDFYVGAEGDDLFDDDSAFAQEDRSRKKLLLLAAALLIVSGVSGFLLLRESAPASSVNSASGAVAVVTPAPTTDPVGTVEPAVVEVVPESGSPQVDLVAASQTAFREKFLVAMELGFGGTAGNE